MTAAVSPATGIDWVSALVGPIADELLLAVQGGLAILVLLTAVRVGLRIFTGLVDDGPVEGGGRRYRDRDGNTWYR